MSVRGMVWFAAVSLAPLCLSAAPARAEMFGFTPITSNSDGSVAQQLSLAVTPSESDVLFTFRNDGPLASSIKLVAFDDSAGLLDSWVILDSPPSVDFALRPKSNLPGGNTLTPKFVEDFGFDKAGNESTGVNPGESLGIKFTLPDSMLFADVITALNAGIGDPTPATGTLRVGIHVGSIGSDGDSDAFVLTPPPAVHTPLAGAFLLGMLGLGTVGLKLRRFA